MLGKMKLSSLIVPLAMALTGVLAQEPIECGDIADEYKDGTHSSAMILPFSYAYDIINTPANFTVVVHSNLDTSTSYPRMECSGTNVIDYNATVFDVGLLGTCVGGSATEVYSYTVSINPVFSANTIITQDPSSGNFTVIYEPTCQLYIENVAVHTHAEQWTIVAQNDVGYSIIGWETFNTVTNTKFNDATQMATYVDVVLNSADPMLKDGELVELEFDLDGKDANSDQEWFQIDDIVGLSITTDTGDIYDETDFALYSEVDTTTGRIVKLLLPTTAFGADIGTATIEGTAYLKLSDTLAAGRRRSADMEPSQLLTEGNSAEFSFTMVTGPSTETYKYGSSASTAAVSATAMVLLSFVACL